MTDNRTNEPKNEALLAALNANLAVERRQAGAPAADYSRTLDDWSEQSKERMRAALEAASNLAKPSISQGNEGESAVGLHFGEAQVEAAAKAVNLAGWTFEGVCEPGEYCDECRKVCVEVARAALVAAGTAPQAESADEVVCQCGHGTGSHDFSDPREPCREVLCGCRRWFGVATVLPSSTVDEDALAEVIAHAESDWQFKFGEYQAGRAFDPGPKAEFVARAVAEWLKDQGVESRGNG